MPSTRHSAGISTPVSSSQGFEVTLRTQSTPRFQNMAFNPYKGRHFERMFLLRALVCKMYPARARDNWAVQVSVVGIIRNTSDPKIPDGLLNFGPPTLESYPPKTSLSQTRNPNETQTQKAPNLKPQTRES